MHSIRKSMHSIRCIGLKLAVCPWPYYCYHCFVSDIDPEEREFQHLDRDIAKLLNAGPIISRSDRETPGPLPGNQRDGRELMESEKVSRSRGEREQPRDTKSLEGGDTPVDNK